MFHNQSTHRMRILAHAHNYTIIHVERTELSNPSLTCRVNEWKLVSNANIRVCERGDLFNAHSFRADEILKGRNFVV